MSGDAPARACPTCSNNGRFSGIAAPVVLKYTNLSKLVRFGTITTVSERGLLAGCDGVRIPLVGVVANGNANNVLGGVGARGGYSREPP